MSGAPGGPAFGRPVVGILLGGSALVLLLGLVSYRPKLAGENLAGPVGHTLAATLLDTLGLGAYAAAGFLLICSFALLAGRPRLNPLRVFAWAAACAGAMALAALLVHAKLQGHLAGGVVGAPAAGRARGCEPGRAAPTTEAVAHRSSGCPQAPGDASGRTDRLRGARPEAPLPRPESTCAVAIGLPAMVTAGAARRGCVKRIRRAP